MSHLTFAFRQFAKTPGFTLVAVATLSLGIGACTAMFSIFNRILLRPLPYAEPVRLVQIWERSVGAYEGPNSVAGGVVNGWREQTTAFEAIAPFRLVSANLTGTARPVQLNGLQVSPDYLHVLRLQPERGRDFQAEEGQTGRDDVVILSHATWRNHFAADPALLGSPILLGNRPRTVIGVLPRDARLSVDADFLLPFACGTEGWSRAFAGHNLAVIGRLNPTATIDEARKEMDAITDRQRPNYPAFKREWGVLLVPLHEQVTGAIRPQLILLLGATACVLLIACANVAGLLLARTVGRRKEIALRLTLGASRWTVVRQLLLENLLLAAAGGAGGVLLSLWSIAAFTRWRPAQFAPGLPVTLDGWALAFAVLVSLGSGLAVGLLPSWRLAHTPFDELRPGGRMSPTALHTRLRGTLIVGQIAVSVVLLLGAGLLLRSLVRLHSVPLGFEPANVLVADLTLDATAFRDRARRVQLLDDILRRVGALPGVEGAAMAPFLPLQRAYTETVRPDGSPTPEALTHINFVTGDYFSTMRIPFHAGRGFTPADNQADAPLTTIINVRLARLLFQTADAVGRRVQHLGRSYEVVGVTGDVLVRGVEAGVVPLLYLPAVRAGGVNNCLFVRAKVSPAALAQSIEAAVLVTSRDQPLSNVRTYEAVLTEAAFARRLMLGLLGLFSGVALALALIGLYAIVAFSVAQRTHELGIRSALGASRQHITALVLTGGLRLTVAGLALGLAAGVASTRFLAAYLYGVSATDPATIGVVCLLLAIAALVACVIPACRAWRVDPMEALRAE